MPIQEYNFDNWLDFVDQAENGDSSMLMGERSSRARDDDKWYGGANWKKTLELARNGWPEGLERMKTKLNVIQSLVPSKRAIKELEMSIVGPGTIDMGRYLMGHPEPWVTWRDSTYTEEVEHGGIVPIVMNITSSAGVSSEAIFQKGAMTCILIDLLERAHRRVELTIITATKIGWSDKPKDAVIVRTMVKRAEDNLDIDRIAFAVAHAGAYRRLGFSIWEQAPESLRAAIGIRQYGNYGRCYEITGGPGAVNIKPSDLYDRSYVADPTEWLKAQLESQGVEWEEEDYD